MSWEHTGNTAAHYEGYECLECGRTSTISNRSDQYQDVGEPEACVCADSSTDPAGSVDGGSNE